MEDIMTALAQYGPLGLWTASLLWMNWQGNKDRKQAEKEATEALRLPSRTDCDEVDRAGTHVGESVGKD